MTTPANPKHSFVYDGARLNVYHVNKGEGLPKHEHQWSHLTMCNAGSCYVKKHGKQILLTKDSLPVDLPANEWHEIEALEDDTVFVNVFAEGKY